MQRSKLWFCATAVLILSSPGFGEDYRPPKEVKVVPVFFVAKDESPPTEQQAANLQKHIAWAQSRYKNPKHHTDGFKPSATPGILIAEDLRALALNRRVFPRLRFDPRTDVPQGYTLQGIVALGPMNIPGHPIISSATPPDAYFARHFTTTLQTSAAASAASLARPGA